MGAQGGTRRLGDEVALVLSPGAGIEPRPSGSQVSALNLTHFASEPNTECGQVRGIISEDTISDLVTFDICKELKGWNSYVSSDIGFKGIDLPAV